MGFWLGEEFEAMRRSGGWTVQLAWGWGHLAFFLALIFFIVTLVTRVAFHLGQSTIATADAPATTIGPLKASFAPPPESLIAEGPAGDSIRRGEAIFTHTQSNAGRFVGNGLTCSNCHLDAGRTANAAPMWAAWVSYPAYRAKNGRVNTMEDRISDCFLYSMNAPGSTAKGPPAPGNPIYRDLEMYFAWLATGAANGTQLNGRGYLKLAPTKLGYEPVRGKRVFAEQCASCHGADAKGQKATDGSYFFPPLAGSASFNWGAGMTAVSTLAGFIKANMPLGQGYSLSDQDAWDVAAYIDSRDRPRDPRQTGTVEDARRRYHQRGDYFGRAGR